MFLILSLSLGRAHSYSLETDTEGDLVVLLSGTIEIVFTADFVIDQAPGKNQFITPDGSILNLHQGDSSWRTFSNFTTAEGDERPDSWRVRWIGSGNKEYGIKIENVAENDSGEWKVQSYNPDNNPLLGEFTVVVA